MTFNKAAWAIDGPTISASLARVEAYAANSGSEGIVQGPDLKVSALASPGQGLRIAAGAALILNRYQGTDIDQCYTVSNSAVHTVGSADMPASNGSAQTYVVAISVGDPEFSQAGHPWMPSVVPTGQEATFTYVRPVVVPLGQWAARTYPALALAKITVPGGVTTITDSMITDLRVIARPRTQLNMNYAAAPTTVNPLGAASERWPDVGVLTVRIPAWAVKAKIMGFVEGARLKRSGVGSLAAYVEGTSVISGTTNIDESSPVAGNDRRSYNFGGVIDVKEIAGTDRTFSAIAAAPGANAGFLETDGNASVMLQVFFEEQPT